MKIQLTTLLGIFCEHKFYILGIKKSCLIPVTNSNKFLFQK